MAKRKRQRTRVNKRLQALIDGKIKVEDLDDEELRRGQMRDKDGGFRGSPWKNVPHSLYKEMANENLRRADKKWQEMYQPAIDVLQEISQNKRLPADARMKSAVYIVERAAGKIPEKQEMSVSVAKWEEDIEDLLTFTGKKRKKEEGEASE